MRYRVRVQGRKGRLQRQARNVTININIERVIVGEIVSGNNNAIIGGVGNNNSSSSIENIVGNTNSNNINGGNVLQGLIDEVARQNAIIDKLISKLCNTKTEIKEVEEL